MNRYWKRTVSFLLVLVQLFLSETIVFAAGQGTKDQTLTLSAESAILMEASTGKILYEKNSEERKPPASVTKVMTLLLIFEAIKEGKAALTDEVTVSAYAASMGGSQVFLEAEEMQTVETLIKCIAVSSANDACVAMAEYLYGSEEAFVGKMNEKAKELGMNQTHFINCCGLDADGHETSAKDIALMSKELTNKYPEVFTYSSIWMDEFTHKTKKGESVFGLSNTNKLLRNYEGCNGLKTGSTQQGKILSFGYCDKKSHFFDRSCDGMSRFKSQNKRCGFSFKLWFCKCWIV